MSFTQDILDALAPMLYAETAAPGPLTAYLGGLSLPFELVETWASDTDTDIGWSLLLDIDRCPDEALPWLAQIVGLKLKSGLSVVDQRQQIRDVPNWKRGTTGAMRGAPAPYLTGSKTVLFRERYNAAAPGPDAPYYIEVITYTSETPDPATVETSIRSQKPTGDVLTYITAAGQDFQSLKINNATFLDVKNKYATFAGAKADMPGV